MTRVLITRPRADAEPLAAALAARGMATLIEPMLDIVPLPGPPLARGAAQGLLFTSVNGVRALAARNGGALGDLAALAVYAVGDGTARAARDAGFAEVESAAGDVAALAELVVARASPNAGALLHIAGSQAAGDLAGQLSAAGFTVDRQMIYEARQAAALSPETADALTRGTIDAVTFFSPRTATAFVTLCRDGGLASSLSPIAAVCLSEAVADAARETVWRAVIVARRPDQAALLDALEAMTSGGADAALLDPEANLPAITGDPAPQSNGEDKRVTNESAAPPPLPPTLLGPAMSEDEAAKETPAPARPRGKRSRVLWSIAALLVTLAAATAISMAIWPDQARRLLAVLSPPPPTASLPPSASVAVTPPRSPAAEAPSAAAPSPSPSDAEPPDTAPDSSTATSPAAAPPAMELETRLNAVESRIAALLDQPVVTPDNLAATLADHRRATEEAARAAAQDAARLVAKDAAEEAVKDARAGQPETAALAGLEQRLAAVEQAAVALSTLGDLERRLAALEKASSAFAALAELERRTGQLEKTAAPLAALGDIERRLAETERAASSAATVSQTAARGDALTLGLVALRDALDRGAPFGDVLGALRLAAAGDGLLVAEADRLAPLAASGVASVARLRQGLAELAHADAAPAAPASSAPAISDTTAPAAAETPEAPRGMLAEVWHRLTSSVVIRRLDGDAAAAETADRKSALARAQALLAAGDLAGAIARLDDDSLRRALGPSQTELEAWLRDARARLVAEISLGALSRRGLALAAAQSAASPAAPATAPIAAPSAAPGP